LQVNENPGVIQVTPPSFRFDLKIEEDLIEEVARMVGFDSLPTTVPIAPITPKLQAENRRNGFAVRRHLADLGYQETINFSFVEAAWEEKLAGNPHPIQLLNPIASQMSVMRSSLIGSLLQVAKFNLDRKAYSVKIFESGRVFKKNDQIEDSLQTVKGIDQPMHLAGLAYGPLQPLGWRADHKAVDFFDVKSDVCHLLADQSVQFVSATHPALHPGRSARIDIAGRPVGWIGELHPQWRQEWGFPLAPVVFEIELDTVLSRPVPQSKSIPRLHPVERDLAIVVNESVTHEALMACITTATTHQLISHAVLFDVYRPSKPDAAVNAGEKSMAVRLFLQSNDDHTLTETQIESVIETVVAQLTSKLSARLRK
jgi:phenylalanyl-tRNA synthetase beta chain